MQRVKISFDRNRDSITEHYLVYRATGSADPLLAYVVSHPKKENPIYVKSDILSKVGGVFYTTHGNIIESREIKVYVDGEQVIPVEINYRDGVINLGFEPMDGSVVTASYWYDGVEFIDTDTPQTGVTPMAPPAVDQTPPLPARNPRLYQDQHTGLVVLEFDMPPESQGTTFRYFVVAADRFGNRSWPSEIGVITLNQNLDDVPFIIQASEDGGITWTNVTETNETTFTDTPIYSGPMQPVRDLSYEVLPNVDGTGSVVLRWNPPAEDIGVTKMYRVITRSALGAYSDPSEVVGPEQVARMAVKYLVKRTDSAGNTVDLGETTATEFTDEGVGVSERYTYAVIAVDCCGNESESVSVEVETGELAPPESGE